LLPPLLLMLAARTDCGTATNRRLVLRCCYAVAFCSSAGPGRGGGIAAAEHPGDLRAAPDQLPAPGLFEQPVMQSAGAGGWAPRAVLNRANRGPCLGPAALGADSGPRSAGVLYAFGPAFDYGGVHAPVPGGLGSRASACRGPPDPGRAEQGGPGTRCWRASASSGGCQAVLGAMLLDLVSTLFGGVNALLPIYARDILEVGAWGGGGWLRRRAGAGRADRRRGAGRAARCGDPAASTCWRGFWRCGEQPPSCSASPTNLMLSIAALMVMGQRRHAELGGAPDPHPGDDPGRHARPGLGGSNSLFYGTSGQLGRVSGPA